MDYKVVFYTTGFILAWLAVITIIVNLFIVLSTGNVPEFPLTIYVLKEIASMLVIIGASGFMLLKIYE